LEYKYITTRKVHQTKDRLVVICVHVVQRKQQNSCGREEQLLIERGKGFVTGKPTFCGNIIG